MKIMLDKNSYMPERAHKTDAGLDLKATEDATIPVGGNHVFDTGVHIEFPHGYYGKIESKSGLNVKYSVVSCGGVLDEGYTGSITVKLYNFGNQPYLVQKGDKIAQIVIQPYVAPELEIAYKLNETERGDHGFGSSGR